MRVVSKEQHAKMIEETITLVDLFLKTNLSDIELSKITGISSSTVGRRLSNKSIIEEAYPEKGTKIFEEIAFLRQENKKQGKIIGGQISLMQRQKYNRENISDVPQLRFNIFFKNPDAEMLFIFHMALTFKTELPTLADLLQIPEKDLERQMTEVKPDSAYYFYNMANYRFDQEEAKIRFVRYYQELLIELKRGKKEMLHELLMAVTDNKAESIIKNRQPGTIINDNDLMSILIYQLKYFISCEETSRIFGIKFRNYQDRINQLLELNPELNRQYDFLMSYYDYKKGRTA